MVLELPLIKINEKQEFKEGWFRAKDIFGEFEVRAMTNFMKYNKGIKLGHRMLNTIHKPLALTIEDLIKFRDSFENHIKTNSWWRWRSLNDDDCHVLRVYKKTRKLLEQYDEIYQPVERVDFFREHRKEQRNRFFNLKNDEIILNDILSKCADKNLLLRFLNKYGIKWESRNRRVVVTKKAIKLYVDRMSELIAQDKKYNPHIRVVDRLKAFV